MAFEITLDRYVNGNPIALTINKPADFVRVNAEEDRVSGRFYLVHYKSSPGALAEMDRIAFTNEFSDGGKEHTANFIVVADHAIQKVLRHKIQDNREH